MLEIVTKFHSNQNYKLDTFDLELSRYNIESGGYFNYTYH